MKFEKFGNYLENFLMILVILAAIYGPIILFGLAAWYQCTY